MFNLLKPVGPSRAPANQSPTHLPKPKIGFQNPQNCPLPRLPIKLGAPAQAQPQAQPQPPHVSRSMHARCMCKAARASTVVVFLCM